MLVLTGLVIRSAASWLWGPPMLIFLSVAGIYLTIQLKGLQFTRFFRAGMLTYRYRTGSGEGNITPFQALLSAVGGLIGNGNIAGTATAIAIGGPGALFWLWIASFIAMILMYAETMLGLVNREKGEDGTYSGGPMQYIEKVLNLRWLAVLFALAMSFKTLFATAPIQSNSISLAVTTMTGFPMISISIALSVLTWLVTIGGIRTIAKTLEMMTPIMIIIYLLGGLVVIFAFGNTFVSMLKLIVSSAFTPAGAAGGFAGATVLHALRYGFARGFYSNEAGTGSAPIMYSTAKSDNPVTQSQVSMFGIVIDTVVSSLTAFVIILTGVWSSGETSTALTTSAFSALFGEYGGYLIMISSFLFGFTSMVAWCFYGEQCFVYVWGPRARKVFRWIFCIIVVFGFLETESLWSLGDLLNGITVIINVSAVFLLVKLVVRETRKQS